MEKSSSESPPGLLWHMFKELSLGAIRLMSVLVLRLHFSNKIWWTVFLIPELTGREGKGKVTFGLNGSVNNEVGSAGQRDWECSKLLPQWHAQFKEADHLGEWPPIRRFHANYTLISSQSLGSHLILSSNSRYCLFSCLFNRDNAE